MQLFRYLSTIIAFSGLALFLTAESTFSQQPVQSGLSIQLPVVRFFDIRTAVSVPDGGTMSLGGVSRSGSFQNSSSIPLLGNLLGAGRAFRNRSTSGYQSATGSSVSVKIISLSELDEDVTAEALRLQATRTDTDPNGSSTVQRQADFLSRNMGRR
jgi:type II secretory pathway component GspD/PulD (secretin)